MTLVRHKLSKIAYIARLMRVRFVQIHHRGVELPDLPWDDMSDEPASLEFIGGGDYGVIFYFMQRSMYGLSEDMTENASHFASTVSACGYRI